MKTPQAFSPAWWVGRPVVPVQAHISRQGSAKANCTCRQSCLSRGQACHPKVIAKANPSTTEGGPVVPSPKARSVKGKTPGMPGIQQNRVELGSVTALPHTKMLDEEKVIDVKRMEVPR